MAMQARNRESRIRNQEERAACARAEFLVLNPQCSIDAARSRPARIAARAAGAGRHRLERLRRAVGLRRKHRQQLLQVDTLTRRARWRLALPRQKLELFAATAALVFKKRHRVFYRDVRKSLEPAVSPVVRSTMYSEVCRNEVQHHASMPRHAAGARTYTLSELNQALADAEAMRLSKALVRPN